MPSSIIADRRKSGTGVPHSKTLARASKAPENPQGFGVRRGSAALDSAFVRLNSSVYSAASAKAELAFRTPRRWREQPTHSKICKVLARES
jgi:hypothetical protein